MSLNFNRSSIYLFLIDITYFQIHVSPNWKFVLIISKFVVPVFPAAGRFCAASSSSFIRLFSVRNSAIVFLKAYSHE